MHATAYHNVITWANIAKKIRNYVLLITQKTITNFFFSWRDGQEVLFPNGLLKKYGHGSQEKLHGFPSSGTWGKKTRFLS